MNIVRAIFLVPIVYTLTIQCTPVCGLGTSVKLQEPANHFWSNPFMVKCHVSPCGAQSLERSPLCTRPRQLWLHPLVANRLTVLRSGNTYPSPCLFTLWPPCRIGLASWTSLKLLPRPLPVMFYLNGMMGPCGSSLTMASPRIGPRVLKINLAKPRCGRFHCGPRYGSGYPLGFARG